MEFEEKFYNLCISDHERSQFLEISTCIYGIRVSPETLDLRQKCYASTADGDAASVLALQGHSGVTVSIATTTLSCDVALFSFCRA